MMYRSKRKFGVMIAVGSLCVTIAAGLTSDVVGQQVDGGRWYVTCAMPAIPQVDWDLNQPEFHHLRDLMESGQNGPWENAEDDGHWEAFTFEQRLPDVGPVRETWVLSETVGWWRLMLVRVHPDDLKKIVEQVDERDVRLIIESPFVEQPVIVTSNDSNERRLIIGQIGALMPSSSKLLCH